MTRVEVLGIRHHGPGSARAVGAALDELQPAVVVVEGPPELDAVVGLVGDVDMRPPVAGLVHAADDPRRAVFWPFAAFSPEWVALRWAAAHGVPARFADLAATHWLGGAGLRGLNAQLGLSAGPRRDPLAELAEAAGYDDAERWWEDVVEHRVHGLAVFRAIREAMTALREGERSPAQLAAALRARARVADAAAPDSATAADTDPAASRPPADQIRHDGGSVPPLDQIRHDGGSDPGGGHATPRVSVPPGEAAMPPAEGTPRAPGMPRAPSEPRAPGRGVLSEARREAAMRRVLRAAVKQVDGTVAFVCGAWHVPAVHPDAWPPASADLEILKGLPRTRVVATWVPWTAPRLAAEDGYGAGVESPGWYAHRFAALDPARSDPDSDADVGIRWLVRVASLLRDEGHDTSPAAVVEGVRLADALARLRGRPEPGLEELTEASRAALCAGEEAPLAVIWRRLVVGDAVGAVPEAAPAVPLARDLAMQRRRMRLPLSAAEKTLELDLRKPTGRARSALLHRLDLLDVGWGRLVDPGRTRGTFKEVWALAWEPELEVALVAASPLGTTVAAAADAAARRRAEDADLAKLVGLVEVARLADLPDTLGAVVAALETRAARQHDVMALMAAIEPLARVVRYGDVRATAEGGAGLPRVLAEIVERAAVGLAAACASLDDEAAAKMRVLVAAVQRGVALIDDAALREPWERALRTVADQRGVHGLVAGLAVRILLDRGRLQPADARLRLSRALSLGADATAGAAWLDGFLAGDALLLLHDPALLDVVDGWIAGVPDQVFDALLPLLRRTTAGFAPGERRLLGEHVRRLDQGEQAAPADDGLDAERAASVVPRVLALLGPPKPAP